jgi:PLP dependent protein
LTEPVGGGPSRIFILVTGGIEPVPQNIERGVSGVEHRLTAIRDRIARAAERAARDPASVTLIGASKGVGSDEVVAAIGAGLGDIGENRVQEAADKIAAITASLGATGGGSAASGERPRWHLIGHLQRNKARQAVRLFDMIQSIDSLKLAEAVDRAALDVGRVVPVLIEVNVAGEATKFGVAPSEVAEMVSAARRLTGIDVVGLMTIGPLVEDAEAARPGFAILRQLRDTIRASGAERVTELSMGMSGDFEVAVEEGATMVRVGRAIFEHH